MKLFGKLIGVVVFSSLLWGGVLWLLRPYWEGRVLLPAGFWVGPIFIHYYGITIALALLLSYLLAHLLWPQRRKLFDELLIPLTLRGVLGGRIGLVLTQLAYYLGHLNEILSFEGGGLSIHGAILGGALVLVWYALKRKESFLFLADCLAPILAFGQTFGRWGNFFNQEVLGGPTNLPWKIFIEPLKRPAGFEAYSFFHPLFLYESLGNLFIFIFLAWLMGRKPPLGSVFGWYLLLYSLLRFSLEFIRLESLVWGVFTLAQWVSLLLAFLGIVLIIKKRKDHKVGTI